MKKNIFFITAFVILSILFFLTGCQQITDQAQDIQNKAQETYSNLQTQAQSIQNQFENTKAQVIDTGTKINEKIDQAKNVADSVGKLVQ